ncbi:MAG: hypothetical protein ACYC4L_20635 [Chloroflexota bacterium]
MRWLAIAVLVAGILGASCVGSPAPAPSPVATQALAAVASATVASPSPTVAATAPATPTAATPTSASVATAAAAATTVPAATPRPPLGTPVGALLLAVTEPAESPAEVPASVRAVTVAGQTRAGAVLSVNGRLAPVAADGTFRVAVPLDEDMTLVEIVASDAAGQQLREQLVVVRAD